jgi:hypothetical protein
MAQKTPVQYSFIVTIQSQPDSTNFGSAADWARCLKDSIDNNVTLADIVSVTPTRTRKPKAKEGKG